MGNSYDSKGFSIGSRRLVPSSKQEIHHNRTFPAALSLKAFRQRAASAALVVLSAVNPAGAQSSLHIVVVEGEDAVNIVQQRTAVAPVVEVRDRNDQPVAGAIVRFTVTKGRATFNGARTLSVATNAAGRAAVTGFTPTSAGALQMTASVTFQGQTIAATIAQTNVMTAAEAATVSATGSSSAGAAGAGAGGGAGGGVSATTLGVVGGAAAGGAIAAKEVLGGSAGGKKYSGTFSGPFTEVWNSPCTIDDAANGTIDITLDIASDGSVSKGEATINATLRRVTLGSGCQGFTLEGGAAFNGDSAPISGTASALTFSHTNSNPVPPNLTHSATIAFAGALSAGQIDGTVTLTDKGTVGSTVVNSGTSSYPIVLR